MSAPAKPWTELSAAEKNAAVKPLILAGLTYQQIANRFGLSNRSIVGGVVNRLRARKELPPAMTKEEDGGRGGLVGRVKAKQRAAGKPHKLATPRGRNPARTEPCADDSGFHISRAAAFDPIPGAEPVPMILNTGCRWPVDGPNGKGLLCCGADRGDHRNYCASHRRLAYQPRQERAA